MKRKRKFRKNGGLVEREKEDEEDECNGKDEREKEGGGEKKRGFKE